MNYKVLITCPDFREFHIVYTRAFENNNCQVLCIPSHLNLAENQYIKRLLCKFGFSVKADYETKKKAYNKEVLDNAQHFKPNLVFCVLPENLYRDTILKLRHESKVIMLLTDTLKVYTEIYKLLDLFEIAYSYEMTDVNYLISRGINAKPLMGTYDETRYFPMDIEKSIDVSFVGKMYPNRKSVLERLVFDLPDVKFKFYGEYAPLRKPIDYLEWRASKRLRESFVNKNIHYKRVNEIYNSSKIVLNINGYQTQSGWSSRLPEISATGAFQIVDNNPYIEQTFANDFVMYKDYEDLKRKVLFYLRNDEQRLLMAHKEYNAVVNMTTTNSLRKVLHDIEPCGW